MLRVSMPQTLRKVSATRAAGSSAGWQHMKISPSSSAASTTVRVRDGETLLSDGPAAEIKEVFGGFTLIECDGLDDALKWAARLPSALDGKVEVRPLLQVGT